MELEAEEQRALRAVPDEDGAQRTAAADANGRRVGSAALDAVAEGNEEAHGTATAADLQANGAARPPDPYTSFQNGSRHSSA